MRENSGAYAPDRERNPHSQKESFERSKIRTREHRTPKDGKSGNGGAGHRTTRARKPTYNVGLTDEDR